MTSENKKKHRVLIVDDDFRLLNTLSSILQENSYEPLIAENLADARKLLSHVTIDALILDLLLQHTDGLDLLKEIRQEKPYLAVIIMTGHGSISKAVEATKLGAFDFLEKPVGSKKILITLENALKNIRLEKERSFLLRDMLTRHPMIGNSRELKQLMLTIEKVAATDSRVLITGECGTGKELVAQALHYRSERAGHPMVSVNCAAIPDDLLETELFGHEKGAFTDASRQKKGKFEMANNGTLFLDEIGEASLRIQPKLLRVIENGEIQRLGSDDATSVDVRLIAATNNNLKEAVQKKKFRKDLFYRLNVIHIRVPPLRDRKSDIPLLAEYFLNKLCYERKRTLIKLTTEATKILLDYSWPGNIRELRNLMEKIAVLSGSKSVSAIEMRNYLQEIQLFDDPEIDREIENEPLSKMIKKREKEIIETKLLSCDWDYETAASELEISRSTIFSKIKELGIKKKQVN